MTLVRPTKRAASPRPQRRRESAVELGARSGEILERRIAQLVDELEHAERAIERLARTKDLEFGIASIYRTVQGLEEGEGERHAKLEMLARIFQTNLELHAARSGRAGEG